jgi:hypothetical protein
MKIKTKKKSQNYHLNEQLNKFETLKIVISDQN